MTPMPTVTLAKIFEEQEKLVEALALYQLISSGGEDLLYSNKISELKKIIFSSNYNEYHKFLVTLFDEDERNEFQILPHGDYENYSAAIKQFKDDEKPIAPNKSKLEESQSSLITDVLSRLDKFDSKELEMMATEKYDKKFNDLTLTEIEELL